MFSKQPPSLQHFSFVCLCGAFHWIPFTIISYATMFSDVPSNPITFAISFTSAYLIHSLILIALTSVFTRLLMSNQKKNQFKTWLQSQMITSCHLRCAKLLSGTEAFCVYLRLLGTKIGKHCSIRAINPVSNPELMPIGAGVHLGDFSRIITGFHSSNGYTWESKLNSPWFSCSKECHPRCTFSCSDEFCTPRRWCVHWITIPSK